MIGRKMRSEERHRQGQRKETLLCGEEEICLLTHVGADMNWIHGDFEPLPAFDKYAPLFDRLKEALTHDTGEFSDLLEESNKLELKVRYAQGDVDPIHDFKIIRDEDTGIDYLEYSPGPMLGSE